MLKFLVAVVMAVLGALFASWSDLHGALASYPFGLVAGYFINEAINIDKRRQPKPTRID